MTAFLRDYLAVSTFMLLIACLCGPWFREPARRVVMARLVLLLLVVSGVVLLVPNRPCVSLTGEVKCEGQGNRGECGGIRDEGRGVGVQSLEFNPQPAHPYAPSPHLESLAPVPSPLSPPGYQQVETASVVVAIPPAEETPEQIATEQLWLHLNPVTWVFGAYFFGMLLVGTWLAFGAIHLRHLLRHAQNAPEEMFACFTGMPDLGQRARVRISPKIATPIVAGTFWPVILIPELFWKEKRKDRDRGLCFAIAHEWAHISNGDLWFLALYRLLAIVLFPNPLFWCLGRRIREDQELLADAHAAAMTLCRNEQNGKHRKERENRRQYALELVRWSRRANGFPSIIPTAGLTLAIREIPVSRRKINRQNESFTRRIDMLLDEKQIELTTSRRWKLLATLLMASAMTVFSMFTLQSRPITVAGETTAGDAAQQSDRFGDVDAPSPVTPVTAFPATDSWEKSHVSLEMSQQEAAFEENVPVLQETVPNTDALADEKSEEGKIDSDDRQGEAENLDDDGGQSSDVETPFPSASEPDGDVSIDDLTVGCPFAPQTLKVLHDEMVNGLNARNVMGRFNTWRDYMSSVLNNTNMPETGSEINALARLSWYEGLYRDPLMSVSSAEQFSRYLHAGLSSGNIMQLAEAMGEIRRKLDVPEQEGEGLKFVRVETPEQAIEEVIRCVTLAKFHYTKAVSTLTPAEIKTLNTQLYNSLCEKETHGHTFSSNAAAVQMLNLLLKVDRRAIHDAAEALIPLSDDRLLGLLKQLDPNQFQPVTRDGQSMHQIVTPAGTILIGGRENHTYNLDDGAEDIICVIDLGGNDTYHEGTCTPNRPVFVIIDLDGDDQYIATKPGVQGGSLLGISMLIDFAGNDTYKAVDVAQGSSIGGVGILIDKDGNDTYHALRRAQGSAFAGVGVLIDQGGNDRYHAAMWSQGFGHSAGFGVLEDADGRDHYYLGGMYEDSYPEHPGYEGWGQGLGAGFRGSAGSACGGIGMLLDGGGDDTYEFDYIAHGGGYWLGVGILRDFGGNDQHIASTRQDYHGRQCPGVSSSPRRGIQPRWQRHGSGFGVHYALGFLFDDAGDDFYEGCIMGMGMGWDLAAGYLCDFRGQ